MDERRRAIEPYLKFVRLLDEDRSLDTRVGHILDEFTTGEFERLAADLRNADVTAGFSIPSVHLERRDDLRRTVADLADAGHEVLLHGHRHTSYMEATYETAYSELSSAAETLASVTGTEPVGFHVPYGRVSCDALRAALDLGVEWVVGATTRDCPVVADGDIQVITPVRPYDLHLLERGTAPEAAFAELDRSLDADSLLLAHPNVHAYHDAMPAFAAWLEDRTVRSPGALAAGEGDGPGLLLDCFPPFTVA